MNSEIEGNFFCISLGWVVFVPLSLEIRWVKIKFGRIYFYWQKKRLCQGNLVSKIKKQGIGAAADIGNGDILRSRKATGHFVTSFSQVTLSI